MKQNFKISQQTKILIIVPAFNEAGTIVSLVEQLSNENPLWDILIVNDGSTDDTGKLAISTGMAIVVNLPINLGIGGAVQAGFKFAERYGYDMAVQCDGDGQHKPSEITKLLEPLMHNKADVVIGSRFCEPHDGWKSTFFRRTGIKVFEVVNSLLIQQRITDNTSGFRAYNKEAIAFLAENYPTDYPEPEAIILLGCNGFRLQEVFVEMQDRQYGRSSISGLRTVYYMMKVLLAIAITSCRPKAKKKGKMQSYA